MQDIQTELKSKFLDKKLLRTPANIKLIKSCIDQKIEAISVWKCFDKETGDLVSCGSVLYRKATDAETPRKIMAVLKIKKRESEILVDDEVNPKPKYETLLDFCLKNFDIS
jgi:hypothetical protein